MDAVAISTVARSAAQTMVERESVRTGSRMVAYEAVAQMIGTSSEWVRKYVKGYAEAAPDLIVGLNILAVYSRVCERVEMKQANEKARADALQDQINAAMERTCGMVARVSPPEAAGGDQ